MSLLISNGRILYVFFASFKHFADQIIFKLQSMLIYLPILMETLQKQDVSFILSFILLFALLHVLTKNELPVYLALTYAEHCFAIHIKKKYLKNV